MGQVLPKGWLAVVVAHNNRTAIVQVSRVFAVVNGRYGATLIIDGADDGHLETATPFEAVLAAISMDAEP